MTGFLTSGKNIYMKAVKVTSKGQITIPIELREALGIDESTYLEVIAAEHEIRLRKIVPTRPLGEDDPIWDLVGVAETGRQDVSTHHDRYLADAEVEQWRESS